MPYLPNIPISTDQLSVSQPQIQSNFTIIQAGFDVDHIDFDATNAGMHKYVELPVATGNPIPPIVFNAGLVALYGATFAATAKNELYVNKTNQGSVVQIPATASILSITATPNNGQGGWTVLPSGIVLIWSSVSNTSPTGLASGLATVTLTIPITITRLFSVVVCPWNNSTNNDINFDVRLVSIVSATQFTVFVSNRTGGGPIANGLPYGFQFSAVAKLNI